MNRKMLDDVSWYTDENAEARGEPGLRHSFVAGLASALDCIGVEIDPAWLMGVSGFAFHIDVNEVMCPSAMSVFDFEAVCREAVEQSGRRCTYISRMWDEGHLEAERRQQAHAAILDAIDLDVPPIVWDIADAEWGLIIGYDEDAQSYATLTCKGTRSALALDRLGRNGIDILSVTIPAEPNARIRDLIIRNALERAVAHAEQKEWTDRPKYQNGLAAFDLWATVFERWSMLVKAGKASNLPAHLPRFAEYYAAHHYGARCYARAFLDRIADGDELLTKAADAYAAVAASLKPLWDFFSHRTDPTSDVLLGLAQNIGAAKVAEQQAVGSLKEYLSV